MCPVCVLSKNREILGSILALLLSHLKEGNNGAGMRLENLLHGETGMESWNPKTTHLVLGKVS